MQISRLFWVEFYPSKMSANRHYRMFNSQQLVQGVRCSAGIVQSA
jgi:hypothetical protein